MSQNIAIWEIGNRKHVCVSLSFSLLRRSEPPASALVQIKYTQALAGGRHVLRVGHRLLAEPQREMVEPSGADLVAGIRPMTFRMPVTLSHLVALTRTRRPVGAAIGHLMQANQAAGLGKIDLSNNGHFSISAIRINVAGASARDYAERI